MSFVSYLLGVVVMITGFSATAQKIVYSEYTKDDTRRMNFEIAGKVGDNFLIYKNIRSKNQIAVLDNDMNLLAQVDQDYLPEYDRMVEIDFFPYNDFVYMIYQYQKKNIVYCMASRIDANGKQIGEVVQLDTTHIGFSANNKIYTVITSDDKSKIIVIKIKSKNRKNFMISTLLFDNNLGLLNSSKLNMPIEEKNNFLTEFNIDNEGDLVFTKIFRNNFDNIGSASLVVKYAMADSFYMKELDLDKTFLDEIRIKVDNFNKRYLITSFFYKQKRSNIDGFYFYIWDKQSGLPSMENSVTFTDELRREAKGDANLRTAFNDYFIRNIIIRKDGGFLIGSEAFYTTSRFSSWNRWDYMYGLPNYSSIDYYYYSPYYSSLWGSSRYRNNQSVRFHADNIVVLSFNNVGKLEWGNTIVKSQINDDSDDLISFQIMNTGNELHFLFTDLEKRIKLLTDFSLSAEGQINNNPTLKNLDRGYEFMPKYAKQVSSKQMIIPCLYRSNFISFAKIDYSY